MAVRRQIFRQWIATLVGVVLVLTSVLAQAQTPANRLRVVILSDAEGASLIDIIALRNLYRTIGVPDDQILHPKTYLQTPSTKCNGGQHGRFRDVDNFSGLNADQKTLLGDVVGSAGRWWIESEADLDAMLKRLDSGTPLDRNDTVVVHVLAHGSKDNPDLLFRGSIQQISGPHVCSNSFTMRPTDLADRLAKLLEKGPPVVWISGSCYAGSQAQQLVQHMDKDPAKAFPLYVLAPVSNQNETWMLARQDYDQMVRGLRTNEILLRDVWDKPLELGHALGMDNLFSYQNFLYSAAVLDQWNRTDKTIYLDRNPPLGQGEQSIVTSLGNLERLRQGCCSLKSIPGFRDPTWPSNITRRGSAEWRAEYGLWYSSKIKFYFDTTRVKSVESNSPTLTKEQTEQISKDLERSLKTQLGRVSIERALNAADADFRCGVEMRSGKQSSFILTCTHRGQLVSQKVAEGLDSLNATIPAVANDLAHAFDPTIPRYEVSIASRIVILIDTSVSMRVNDFGGELAENTGESLRYHSVQDLLSGLNVNRIDAEIALVAFSSAECTRVIEVNGQAWWKALEENARHAALKSLRARLDEPPCEEGTNIVAALEKAQSLFASHRTFGKANRRNAVVMISDGAMVPHPAAGQTTPRQAGEALVRSGATINVINLQAEDGGLVRRALRNPKTQGMLVRRWCVNSSSCNLKFLETEVAEILAANDDGKALLKDLADLRLGFRITAESVGNVFSAIRTDLVPQLGGTVPLDGTTCTSGFLSDPQSPNIKGVSCPLKNVRLGVPLRFTWATPPGFKICRATVNTLLRGRFDVPTITVDGNRLAIFSGVEISGRPSVSISGQLEIIGRNDGVAICF